jgi:FkbM family methyltransferase
VRVALAGVLGTNLLGQLIGWWWNDVVPVPRFGLRVRTNSAAISPSVKAQLFFGIFESAEIRLVQRYLSGRLPVVELGAGAGVVSAAIAQRLAAGLRHICVEANPALIPVLSTNCKSGADSAAVILNAAVDYSGTATAALRTEGPYLRSRVTIPGPETSMIVPTTRLRDLVRTFELAAYALVCDIEGGEAGILFDDGDALRNCREICIELHRTKYRGSTFTQNDLLKTLRDTHGFELVMSIGNVHYLRARAQS